MGGSKKNVSVFLCSQNKTSAEEVLLIPHVSINTLETLKFLFLALQKSHRTLFFNIWLCRRVIYIYKYLITYILLCMCICVFKLLNQYSERIIFTSIIIIHTYVKFIQACSCRRSLSSEWLTCSGSHVCCFVAPAHWMHTCVLGELKTTTTNHNHYNHFFSIDTTTKGSHSLQVSCFHFFWREVMFVHIYFHVSTPLTNPPKRSWQGERMKVWSLTPGRGGWSRGGFNNSSSWALLLKPWCRANPPVLVQVKVAWKLWGSCWWIFRGRGGKHLPNLRSNL